MPSFATVLTHTMQAAGLSQRALSRRTGISQKHISQIVTGKVDPSLSVVERLCAHVGLTITFTTTQKEQE